MGHRVTYRGILGHMEAFRPYGTTLALVIEKECFAMVCSDIYDGPVTPMISHGVSLVPTEERLSALSPSDREHFLESVAYHKDMLVELAKM